jgi:hypothetical protein
MAVHPFLSPAPDLYPGGLTLSESTSDYSLFTRVPTRIDLQYLSPLLNTMVKQHKSGRVRNKVFTFKDVTDMIAKINLSEERDKAMQQRGTS